MLEKNDASEFKRFIVSMA